MFGFHKKSSRNQDKGGLECLWMSLTSKGEKKIGYEIKK